MFFLRFLKLFSIAFSDLPPSRGFALQMGGYFHLKLRHKRVNGGRRKVIENSFNVFNGIASVIIDLRENKIVNLKYNV